MECQAKYGNVNVWDFFVDMFEYLPIAAVVGNTIFCVHGGLSPAVELIQDID